MIPCKTKLKIERTDKNEQRQVRIKNKFQNKEVNNSMTETKITLLTIKQAAELVNGLTEYRVRQMCVHGQLPHIKAGKKYLINKEIFLKYICCETR